MARVGGRSGITFSSTWNVTPLQHEVAIRFRGAVYKTRDVARAGSTSTRVARTISARLFSGGAFGGSNLGAIIRAASPLAHLRELGVQPHTIAPIGKPSAPKRYERGGLIQQAFKQEGIKKQRLRSGKTAMKFPDGNFSRGEVQHPGHRPYPFMRPAAAQFPALFRRELSRSRWIN